MTTSGTIVLNSDTFWGTLAFMASTSVTDEVVVYRARNTVNGNCYIGVTQRGLTRREHEHRYSARTGGNTRLHKALRKWGDKIQFEVVRDFDGDYAAAMLFEAEIVERERPVYNLVPGGLNRIGKPSAETLAKMRAAQLGKASPKKGRKMPEGYVSPRVGTKHSAETRAKISAAHAGKSRPNRVGLKHSDEAKAKMSAAQKGRIGYWRGKTRPDIGAKVAAALTGRVSPLRGVPKNPESVAKMRASKIGVPQKQTPAVVAAREANHAKMIASKRKPVVCLSDGRRFGSAKEAGDFYELSGRAVAGVASGKRPQKSIKGLRFIYEVLPS